MNRFVKNFISAFSLATFLLFPSWYDRLNSHWYFDLPGFAYDPASMIFVWLFTLPLVCLLVLLFYASSYSWVRLILEIFIGISIVGVFTAFQVIRPMMGNYISLAWAVLLLLSMIFTSSSFQSKFWDILQKIVLIVSPFALIVTVKVLWIATHLPEEQTTLPQQHVVFSEEQAPRIIWMVFDEVDMRLAFEHPDSPPLPHFERLKKESLYATQAYPAGPNTIDSLPAMISGLSLQPNGILSDRNMSFARRDTGELVAWDTIPDIFVKAKNLGFHTAILGNYHPYSRIYEGKVDYAMESCKSGYSVWKHFEGCVQMAFQKFKGGQLSLLHPFQSMKVLKQVMHNYRRSQYIASYYKMLDLSKTVCCDPFYNFVLIHWTVPHYPGIYNAVTKEFLVDYPSNYVDNLVLMDDTLGQLYDEMQQAGVWDSTTVIVTSDHWLRLLNLDQELCCSLSPSMRELISHPDCRVPLFVKMANQRASVVYQNKFRLTGIHQMLEEMLKEQIKSPGQLVDWLEKQESVFTLEGLE